MLGQLRSFFSNRIDICEVIMSLNVWFFFYVVLIKFILKNFRLLQNETPISSQHLLFNNMIAMTTGSQKVNNHEISHRKN